MPYCGVCETFRQSVSEMLHVDVNGETRMVCPTCIHSSSLIRRCEECGDLTTLTRWTDGRAVCTDCLETYSPPEPETFECAECGREVESVDEDDLCERCRASGGVETYDFDPSLRFMTGAETRKGRVISESVMPSVHRLTSSLLSSRRQRRVKCGRATPGQLFYGVEIEVEYTRGSTNLGEFARNLRRATGDCVYTKHDGSLSYGFEIVTMPFTWGWLESKGKKALAPVWRLRRDGFRGYDTNTCGMHVHMSKDAFTPSHLYKFLQLLYGHPQFLLLVSRRKKQQLNEWACPTWGSERVDGYEYDEHGHHGPRRMNGDTISRAARQKVRGGKYRAVNLSNESTVEVRIFRSTLSYGGFMQRMEFVKSAYDFTLQSSIRDALQLRRYIGFVRQHETDYPHLVAFLAEKYRSAALRGIDMHTDTDKLVSDGQDNEINF